MSEGVRRMFWLKAIVSEAALALSHNLDIPTRRQLRRLQRASYRQLPCFEELEPCIQCRSVFSEYCVFLVGIGLVGSCANIRCCAVLVGIYIFGSCANFRCSAVFNYSFFLDWVVIN